MTKINDIDLKAWSKYDDLITDSLWLIDKRDNSGSHKGDYHGNFIPQIPNQLIRRFTKENDIVLDTFLGSGTTLIECSKLKRNGIGIDISKNIANIARKRIRSNKSNFTEIIVGDSKSRKTRKRLDVVMKKHKRERIQLMIMHPPYHDIIQFTKEKNDLSNSETTDLFISNFLDVVDNFIDLLEKDRFLSIVIGDKYEKKEWIPLGFLILDKIRNIKSLKLKSIIIKDMQGNRAKRNLDNLWRYRALKGNYYIFKHEYIFLFEKVK